MLENNRNGMSFAIDYRLIIICLDRDNQGRSNEYENYK
jgi:hypothetical protein